MIAALLPGAATAKPSARPVGHVLAAPNIRPGQPVAIGAKLVLAAFTRREGKELYVSDGSARGTRMIESIAPGPRWPVIEELTPAGGHAFFSACHRPPPRNRVFCGAATARRLWVTDGTARGTHPVRGAKALDIVAIRPLGGDRVAVAVAEPDDVPADGLDLRRHRRRDLAPGRGRAGVQRRHAPASRGRRRAVLRQLGAGRQRAAVAQRRRTAATRRCSPMSTARSWPGSATRPWCSPDRSRRCCCAGPGDPPLVDLGTLSAGPRAPVEQIVVADGLAYISSQAEVWRVDGTRSGTQLVATTP